jgi:hypothetical protein
MCSFSLFEKMKKKIGFDFNLSHDYLRDIDYISSDEVWILVLCYCIELLLWYLGISSALK